MTEDEAKTKACCGPLLIASSLNALDDRATSKPGADGRCIGSACMAWRRMRDMPDPTDPALLDCRDGFGRVFRVVPSSDGFCGLAGVPA